jgi:hypothetical protein
MTIRIQFDDGHMLVMTPLELTLAFLEFLERRPSVQAPPLIEEHCRHCRFGRTESGYCSYCKLGRDLKAVETRMTFNPVGGMDDDGEGEGRHDGDGGG